MGKRLSSARHWEDPFLGPNFGPSETVCTQHCRPFAICANRRVETASTIEISEADFAPLLFKTKRPPVSNVLGCDID